MPALPTILPMPMAARPESIPAAKKIDPLRVPPNSIEAEQAVLGGLMLSSEAWDKVADRITEGDFYRRDHALIFRAIGELSNKSMPADAVTLGEWFEAQGIAELVGGSRYILELANTTPSAANIAAYADIVREKSVLRQLIDAGTEIAGDAFVPEGRSSHELLETAEQKVFRIAEAGSRGRKGFVSRALPSRKRSSIASIATRIAARHRVLPTGLRDFDDMTAGLQPSDLIIIAARPSMGKTALALNMAEYAAIKGKKAVAVFSMEMSASQLAFRLISSLGRINQQHLRTGELEDADWPRVTSAHPAAEGAKIFIDDTPALSPGELRARARASSASTTSASSSSTTCS
jgi:replicative DNA helicase